MSEVFFASARKYRPQKFNEVIGQGHIVKTLKNAIQNHKISQSFLFHGPRGVGKTTCARILAKTINCENVHTHIEACNECEACQTFNQKNTLNIFELDAASNNSVDDIRNLTDQVWIGPQVGKYKIYIIDEVHMLSQAAFNAFLKTLEDPPEYAVFILATTEKQKVIPTIISRCQVFDFHKISIPYIIQCLEEIATTEKIQADKKALELIAKKSDGSLRDALYLFDRLAGYSSNHISYQNTLENLHVLDNGYYESLIKHIVDQNMAEILLSLDHIILKGFELKYFLEGLAEYVRALMLLKNKDTAPMASHYLNLNETIPPAINQISFEQLKVGLDEICKTEIDLKNTTLPRINVELCLIKLCHLIGTKTPSEHSTQNNTLSTPSSTNPNTTQTTTTKNIQAKEIDEPIGQKSVGATKDTKPYAESSLLENRVEENKAEYEGKDSEKENIASTKQNKNKLFVPDLKPYKKENTSKPDKWAIEKEVDIRFEKIDKNNFSIVWEEFNNTLKTQTKSGLASIIKNLPLPAVTGNAINIVIHSEVLLSTIEKDKYIISDFLKKFYSQPIDVNITFERTNNKTEKIPFTSKEKLAYFVSENKHFLELYNKLELRVKY